MSSSVELLNSPARSARLDEELLRRATDFSDVVALASKDAPGFVLASQDDANRIVMYTKPVAASPIHMMKASARMPCAPKDFLRYLEMDVRSIWDDHFLNGRIDRFLGPGQSTQLKHITFLSPMRPLLRNRDFELVVSEKVCENGTALLKAFSPPEGYIVPPPSKRDGKVVRGQVLLSGFVAEPVGDKECDVTYIALVLPNGRVPPMLVNIVIGKQTRALVHLQRFIKGNPLHILEPRLKQHLASKGHGKQSGKEGRLVTRSKL